MKKITAILLSLLFLATFFVIPASADDTVNYEEEFKFTTKAPKVDGKVSTGEYGVLPIHTYPEDKNQFVDNEFNDYAESDWDFGFYGVWDAEYLYMAWVIKTDVHVGIPEKDFSGNDSWGAEDYGYMWMYSCVQFIFTPGAPSKGETNYQSQPYGGDYLEVGLALTAENNPIRIVWNKPVNSAAFNVNDWDAAIVRDDAKKTTTYEVRIPWNKSGIDQVGNGAQFGLTYSVAAQEHEVKCGMIEWQNGVLSAKDADSAAVITLKGDIVTSTTPSESPDVKTNGALPSDAKNAVQIPIDGVNTHITAEKAYLYTDPSKVSEYNNRWAAGILLKPVQGESGYYTVVERKYGYGEPFSFDSKIEKGMIAFLAHTDGEGVGQPRREKVDRLCVGDKLGLFGVDLNKGDTTYLNAMLYVVYSVLDNLEDTSKDISEVAPNETSKGSNEDTSDISDTSKDTSIDGALDSLGDSSKPSSNTSEYIPDDVISNTYSESINDFSLDISIDEPAIGTSGFLSNLLLFSTVPLWIIIVVIIAILIIIAAIVITIVWLVKRKK